MENNIDYKTIKWNKQNYQNWKEQLLTYQDIQYRDFNQKIVQSNYPMIGIRTPILKNIAKSIIKGDYLSFIQINSHETYEEVLLIGIIITLVKLPQNDALELYNQYIPYIDNWAMVDMTTKMKSIHNLDELWNYIQDKLQSPNPWEVRVGILLMMNYFIKDDTIHQVLKTSIKIKNDHYYVKMAIAWLLSICYIKFPNETETILIKKQLDPWTHNKTISKICDSYRVPKDQKDHLKGFKR